MVTNEMQTIDSVCTGVQYKHTLLCPIFFLFKGGGLFISEKNQHGIAFTASLGEPDAFDVAGDP